MRSKIYRPSPVPVQELPVTEPIDRVDFLNRLQRLINAGMCVSALSLAQASGVQFNAATLRNWSYDSCSDDLARHRRVYAFLAKTAKPVPVAEPIPLPAPQPVIRRRFVRSSARVA